MKRCYYIFIFIAVFLINTANVFSITGGTPVSVTEVHDGDTLTIRTKSLLGVTLATEKVRLTGIDAPEIKQEPWGRRAKKHLKKLVNESGGVVYIEYDFDRRDKHGRILAYLWDKKGRMINEKMIEDGYAVIYTFPPNVKYVKQLTEAQQKARQNKLGIWGKDGLKETPKDWRKENPR